MADKMLDKVAALLRQAEGTDNEAEAAAFVERAQQLASVHSIDLALARQHQAKKEQREQPITKRLTIGDPGKKGLKYFVHLFGQVARNNDVKYDVAHNSTYVIAYGFPSDIEVVETLYASLSVQMVLAANTYLASGEYKKETRNVYDRWGFFVGTKPVDGRIARGSFYDGFWARIGQRLREARKQAQEQTYTAVDVETGEAVQTTGALVLKGKEVEVQDFYQAKSTARGSWQGGRRSATSGSSSAGYRAGSKAGQNARLGGQGAIGGSRSALSA